MLAHMARDELLSPPLTGQYLCVPALMCFLAPEHIPEKYRAEYLSHPAVTPSIDPVLLADKNAEASLTALVGVSDAAHEPRFAPFLYDHVGLPPAYFQVCGLDPLRDEGLIYERVLREEQGIATRLDLYPGFGHYFWTNWPLLEKSKEFVEDTVKGVRWLLEQRP